MNNRNPGRAGFVCGVVMTALVVLTSAPVLAQEAKQQSFPSAEEAVNALVAALRANDTNALLRILGPTAKPLVTSGDPVSDRRTRERFVQDYDESHKLVAEGDARMVLAVGKSEWPLPIPAVKHDAGWMFDTAAGKEEILNRRIGANELAAIQACLAFVDAQHEYVSEDRNGDGLREYAQRIRSTPGKHDGLYWEAKPGEPQSPLGPQAARAAAEGYKGQQAAAKQAPYHGYYYRILTAQGKDAPDGAYSYLARGKMIGGFALVAYPASYGASGVMTFIVNHDGIVYQKDFGPGTASVAAKMKTFNPDDIWRRI